MYILPPPTCIHIHWTQYIPIRKAKSVQLVCRNLFWYLFVTLFRTCLSENIFFLFSILAQGTRHWHVTGGSEAMGTGGNAEAHRSGEGTDTHWSLALSAGRAHFHSQGALAVLYGGHQSCLRNQDRQTCRCGGPQRGKFTEVLLNFRPDYILFTFSPDSCARPSRTSIATALWLIHGTMRSMAMPSRLWRSLCFHPAPVTRPLTWPSLQWTRRYRIRIIVPTSKWSTLNQWITTM